MKNGIHADKSKRELYRKYEVKRIICKILLLNKGLSNELKKKQFEELSKLPRNSSITRIKSECWACCQTKEGACRSVARSGSVRSNQNRNI